jgi:uncharacterized membrane protein
MSQRTLGMPASYPPSQAGSSLQQENWTVLRSTLPARGVECTWCVGVSERGDMVGWRVNAPGMPNRAFLMSDGYYYDLHPECATSSLAAGINRRGDIVGDYWVGSQEHGFLLRRGNLITIDLEAKARAHLRGINYSGDIVGAYLTTNTSLPQGFLLTEDGPFVEVQYEGSISSWALDINDRGDIVGQYTDARGAVRGFLRTAEGEFSPLDYPEAIVTSAEGISARGEVVGHYRDASTPAAWHGFRWYRGAFEQDDSGATHVMSRGINARATRAAW